jgi:hypothetical protein
VYRKLAELELPPAPPADAELARRYGDLGSRTVHTHPDSVRRKWLHRWMTDNKVPWLPRS